MKFLRYFIFSITFVAPLFVSAQKINYGLTAGLNYANITYAHYQSDPARPPYRYGAKIGFTFNFLLSNKLELQIEPGYISKGTKALSLDYLSVPLCFKYYITEGVFCGLGPEYGYLFNQSNYGYYKNELSAQIVAGFSPIQSTIIQFRYSNSLTIFTKEESDLTIPSFWYPEARNHYYQISLCYLLK